MKRYKINEIFYSLQGEGERIGTANVFVRFSGCNMRCAKEAGPKSPGGFDCDTEFESGRSMSIEDILERMRCISHDECSWVILTGGEPALQVDDKFIKALHDDNWLVAIETNGSIKLPMSIAGDYLIDWITVSPKVAEHAIKQTYANEVKYVRGHGQGIPQTKVIAAAQLISPAFNGLEIDQESLSWCVKLVKENPRWRLCPQLHKGWMVR